MEKYLKYKYKYINLQKLKQQGGTLSYINETNKLFSTCANIINDMMSALTQVNVSFNNIEKNLKCCIYA